MRDWEVLFIELGLHFFPKSYGWLAGLTEVVDNTIPMEFCFSYKFHFGKPNLSILRQVIPLKKMLHLAHPIIVNLRVPNTIEGRGLYFDMLSGVVFIISMVLPRVRAMPIIISSIMCIFLVIPLSGLDG